MQKPIIVTMPKRDITIIPIFDVHIGAAEFCEKEFVNFINEYRDKKDVYFVLGGDLINNGIKTSCTNTYEELMRPMYQKNYAATLLEPIKDRILCAVSGNHEIRSKKETDTDIVYDICDKLGIADVYRDDVAFLTIRIPSEGKNKYLNYNICVTHGIKSAVNTMKFATAISGLDALIVGHTHTPKSDIYSRFKVDNRTHDLVKENFAVMVASSWLEWGSYASRAMLLPTARIEQELILSSEKERVGIIQYWDK